jgi:glycosyltransferase involved in cell wall biosynthesis
VIICCYNGEQFLEEAVDSVLAQTLSPLEVIVIDDGSTDSSAQIARSYGERVRVISQTNRGLPASRNVGIAAARGEYLFFIDADDLIHPASFEHLRASIQSRHDTVAIMGFATFRENFAKPIAEQLFESDDFFPEIICGNFGPQHNRLVPKQLALRAGCFDPTMYLYEDWLFWCRVALSGARLAPIPFVGAYYRRHEATMSDTAPETATICGHIRVMEELGEGMLRNRDLLDRWGEQLFWSAWVALHRAHAAGISWRALRRLSRVLYGIVRVGPPEIRRSMLAKSIRLFGAPLTESLWSLVIGPSA